MMMRRWVVPVLAGLILGGSTALAAQDPAILSRVVTGEWLLHRSGSADGAGTRLCVTRAAQLVELRQSAQGCTRMVLGQDARSATVSFSCPTGTGRTTLTMTGGGSAHIATQGLANGEPFDVDYDARLLGRCG